VKGARTAVALALAAACALLLGVAPPSSRADVRLTVAGDSLALGIGASDSSRGFAFDLFQRVRATHPASEITNLAIGGATTEDVVRLELPRLAQTHPTVVLVEVGANDLVRRHPATTFARDYGRLVDGARRDAPGARIVLFNVPRRLRFCDLRRCDESAAASPRARLQYDRRSGSAADRGARRQPL